MKINSDIAAILKSYVYVYIDPRNGLPFYIGKGKGNRAYAHFKDRSVSDKVAKIKEIRSQGKEPVIEILRYGLSDDSAALVEAAAIDLISKGKLTNMVAGYHKGSYGRISTEDLEPILAAKPAKVRHKAILITINRLYRSDMTSQELYEATRGIWKLGPRRKNADYAMAVYQGIVREVYRIHRWHPAGTTSYKTRDAKTFKDTGRWEFTGSVADELHDLYVKKSVGRGNQNPIRYVNI